MSDKKAKKDEVKVEDLPQHLVIYTDGGSHHKPGVGGWGFHGYLFVEAEPKKGSGCPGHSPTAKGYMPNSDKAIKKVTVLKYVDGCGSMPANATNNAAELEASIQAMHMALETEAKSIHFIKDSKYVLNGIQEWLPNWKEKGYKKSTGEDISNKNQWQQMDGLLKTFEDRGIELTFQWVKGHSGNPGNSAADLLASKGLIVGQKRMDHSIVEFADPTGYWNVKAEFSRLFGASRLIFFDDGGECVKNSHGYYNYHLFDPPSNWDFEFYGTRESDACMGVVWMKEADPAISKVKALQKDLNKGKYNSVISMRLDTVFKPRIYNEIVASDGLYLYTRTRRGDMFSVNNTPLTNELRPPRLAFRGVEELLKLENLLETYVDLGDKSFLTITDITPNIYEEKKSKDKTDYKIRKDLTTAVKFVDLNVNVNLTGEVEQKEVRMVFGIDLPKRNVLSAVAGLNPEVKVISWKQSDSVFHIATILKTDDGIGIWTNVYTNYRLA